ncbi:DNA photolyase family protein [Zavarzinia compransoris]|uniref:cryptochrome/photolyase family protein n=1 Tax=Zavarzinia marina TaxID=2911065 RepID=UPI001F440B92|nr:deoxyribodipyrimidine photo-lyase [Zavarzinia marina]MCF4165044.1 DNA photolyase family protein [Zavarzinia marina]
MPRADTTAPVLVWFRRDLRLADNPALAYAAGTGRPVVPLFILDEGDETLGGAGRWWLHQSVAALARELRASGHTLVLRRGDAARMVAEVAQECGAAEAVWNRLYHPAAIERDTGIRTALTARGIAATSFNAALLFEPWTIASKAGTPFRVFTPFWRACRAAPPPDVPGPPPRATAFAGRIASDALDDWHLPPRRPDWAAGFVPHWTPGEAGAADRLRRFIADHLCTYARDRDRPDLAATTRLSPHLAFGEIGPRQVWHALHHAVDREPACAGGAERLLSELGWREFSYHLLCHAPEMATTPLRSEFTAFPWRRDDAALSAWQRGLTGYPIVDAGMRELWRTGWMHNRVRMIAASFLVKDLLQPWQAGEAWFRDTLLDADPASNAASWQWVAGCGTDAAPFFRVFNPVLQGRKFDPAGDYVRRFVPELAALPAEAVHEPWAHGSTLARAGIVLGRDYPAPIVDHGFARARALEAFATLKENDAA